MSQKRNSSDAAAAARKASFAEQNKTPGFLGGLWHKYDPESPSRNSSAMTYSFGQFHKGAFGQQVIRIGSRYCQRWPIMLIVTGGRSGDRVMYDLGCHAGGLGSRGRTCIHR